jgi:hypothetical protein
MATLSSKPAREVQNLMVPHHLTNAGAFMNLVYLVRMNHGAKRQIENGSTHWNGLPSAVQWAAEKLD